MILCLRDASFPPCVSVHASVSMSSDVTRRPPCRQGSQGSSARFCPLDPALLGAAAMDWDDEPDDDWDFDQACAAQDEEEVSI